MICLGTKVVFSWFHRVWIALQLWRRNRARAIISLHNRLAVEVACRQRIGFSQWPNTTLTFRVGMSLFKRFKLPLKALEERKRKGASASSGPLDISSGQNASTNYPALNAAMTRTSSSADEGIQPHPPSLWTQAYELWAKQESERARKLKEMLSAEASKAGIAISPAEVGQNEEVMMEVVEAMLNSVQTREWKLQIGANEIKVRKQVDQVVSVLTAVKDFSITTAALDPLHAGLPVAGLCLILQVSCTELWELIQV
jgi:N-terminal domain of NWD NACHT-NTPase